MRLILTSEGIRNKSIEKAFFELVKKPAEEITLVYVPTAAMWARTANKRWMVDAIVKLSAMNIGSIDFVDFAALPKEVWLPRIENADVIYVEGGHPKELLESIEKSGFAKMLPKLLKEKVYVGSSAGSAILTGQMFTRSREGNEPNGIAMMNGYGIVPFSIRPHYLRKDTTQFTPDVLEELSKKFNTTIYAFDDNTALKVEDSQVEVISEGKWQKFKP